MAAGKERKFWLKSKTFGSRGKLKIDIGCGSHKREGFLGIDSVTGEQVDFVVDVEKESLPFPDNSVDHVFSNHAFEHIVSPQHVLREIVRVCRHDALVEIWTPYLKSKDAFLLGHFNFYNESIWKHICLSTMTSISGTRPAAFSFSITTTFSIPR